MHVIIKTGFEFHSPDSISLTAEFVSFEMVCM